MKRPLRLPATLAFAVLGGAAAVGVAPSCSNDKPAVDASVGDAAVDGQECALFCIPDGTDAGVCDRCADTAGNCPVGCRPVG